jgi:hypothetical protein
MKAFFQFFFRRKPAAPAPKKLPAFMQRHIAAQEAGVFGYHN